MDGQAFVLEQEDDIVLDKLYDIEQSDWKRINRELCSHGMPTISILHPNTAVKSTDVVVMEPETARIVRQTLMNLMRDGDKRQELIQELILTNNSLREELHEQTTVSKRYEIRSKELKSLLDSSNHELQELEEKLQQQSATHTNTETSVKLLQEEEEKFRLANSAILLRCNQLQHKCEMQEEEIKALKESLKCTQTEEVEILHERIRVMLEEDQKRSLEHNQMFSELSKKVARSSEMDERIIHIMDSYEQQIRDLKTTVEILRTDKLELEANIRGLEIKSEHTPPRLNLLIKRYENEIFDAKQKLKESEGEIELLKLEMQSRPDLKDYRQAQVKIKKLEHTITKMNDDKDERLDTNRYSTKVNDIEYLPATHAHVYLKTICDEFGVHDLEDVLRNVQQHRIEIEAYPRLEQFCKEVLRVVGSSDAPLAPEFANKKIHHSHKLWCDKTWRHVIPTLEYWLQQVKSLKELRPSLSKLTNLLTSHSHPKPMDDLSSPLLSNLLQNLILENDSLDTHPVKENPLETDSKKQTGKDESSKVVLQPIVDHFMKLFDVKNPSGVYARMNDVYIKLGEMQNILKALRNMLGLEGSSKPHLVVEAISQLVENQNGPSQHILQQLLKVNDLSVVIRKLEEHREFFPVFRDLVLNLMKVLDVTKIDQILPAVRTMKLMTS